MGNTLNSGGKAPQNPYNMASEYAFSNIDSPFRWSTSVSYELPVGKGKALLGGGGPASYILGGWVVNTVSGLSDWVPVANQPERRILIPASAMAASVRTLPEHRRSPAAAWNNA